jgi:hypothetical protein
MGIKHIIFDVKPFTPEALDRVAGAVATFRD